MAQADVEAGAAVEAPERPGRQRASGSRRGRRGSRRGRAGPSGAPSPSARQTATAPGQGSAATARYCSARRAAAVGRQVEGDGEGRPGQGRRPPGAGARRRGSAGARRPARGAGTPARLDPAAARAVGDPHDPVRQALAPGRARRSPGSRSIRRGLRAKRAVSRAAMARVEERPRPGLRRGSRRVTMAASIRVSRRRAPAGRIAAAVARRYSALSASVKPSSTERGSSALLGPDPAQGRLRVAQAARGRPSASGTGRLAARPAQAQGAGRRRDVEAVELRQRLEGAAGRHRPVDDVAVEEARRPSIAAGAATPRSARIAATSRSSVAALDPAGDPVADRASCRRRPRRVSKSGKAGKGRASQAQTKIASAVDHAAAIDRRDRVVGRLEARAGRVEPRQDRLEAAGLDQVVARRRARRAGAAFSEDFGSGKTLGPLAPLSTAGTPISVSQIGLPRGTQAVARGLDAAVALDMRVRPPADEVLGPEDPGLAVGAVGDRRADLRRPVGLVGVVPVEGLAGAEPAAEVGRGRRSRRPARGRRGRRRRASRRAAGSSRSRPRRWRDRRTAGRGGSAPRRRRRGHGRRTRSSRRRRRA